MRRTFAGLVLLTLVLPGWAVAGPPEWPSGKMAFDTVADGLRKYRKEKDEERRVWWLHRLAPTHDPRVAVTLGEAMDRDHRLAPDEQWHAKGLLLKYYAGPDWSGRVGAWWEQNEADLRRRAKQLPR
jgi:hypothetical protein